MLNDLPREKLRFIIEEYGRSAIRDSNRCRELLREHAPENLRETNLLTLVLTEGFVWELTSENLELVAQRLHDEFGIKEEFAFWAVESWAFALNLIQIPLSQKVIESVIELPEKEIDYSEMVVTAISPEKEQLPEPEELLNVLKNSEESFSYDEINKKNAWFEIKTAFENETIITGQIEKKINGGFNVNLGYLHAFLPGSLACLSPPVIIDVDEKNTNLLDGRVLKFKIVKIDSEYNNIVLSRLAVIEEKYGLTFQKGATVVGVVSSFTALGAVIDLGDIYGWLRITDMTRKHITHPSEYIEIGQEIEVKFLKYDIYKNRINLKGINDKSWQGITQRYSVGMRVIGKVNKLINYGCFVEIEEGVEGLVHVSEMVWENDITPLESVIKLGDRVEVIILEIDEERRRISLSMKQCKVKVNPWIELDILLNSVEQELEAKNITANFTVPLLKDEATQDFEDMF
jgi:predicted RNA-binding protein with RPS1 domain